MCGRLILPTCGCGMVQSFDFQIFAEAWPGGYFEGDPRDPMGGSSYGIFGYYSGLHVVYLCCIKPFINPNTVVLEIGPGRGAWTKAISERNPKHIYAVDVVPPDHFLEYVGRSSNIDYIQTNDFSLGEIQDGSIDYFFSFGCFCHLRPEMCIAYIDALAIKMKCGAHGFLMISDFHKWNTCIQNHKALSIERSFLERKFFLVRLAYHLSLALAPRKFIGDHVVDDGSPRGPFDWYDFGVERACGALSKAGFEIVERDMNINHRDPIIHFVKA
jgi:Methyltransferase domain